jgi:hypothetical protein
LRLQRFPNSYDPTQGVALGYYISRLWRSAFEGTDIYTLDSSICNAAVHAGKLTMESGGPVTIELRPGESSYKGTTRNGIKTNDYGKYGQSFVVK